MLRSLVSWGAALLVAMSSIAHAQDGARRDDAPPPPRTPTLTSAPELIEAAAPDYPPAALAANREAAVKVRIHIDAAGKVTRVEVPEPAGHGFDEAAIAAVEQYRFKPAEWDGVPGPIIVETTIHFTIQEEEVAEPEPPPPPPGHGQPDPAAMGPPSHGGDVRLPVRISGQAVERGTRRKLTGVIVSVAELGMDAITDEQGNFYFHGVPAGDYTILAVGDDHARLERKLPLAVEEKSLEIRLWLRRKGSNPYETVVEGEREVLEVTKRTLQRRQLTSVPGTFGDPIRVIQTLPGMGRPPFGLGALYIRGSNPDDSGIFIDGHRVPLIFHFLGGPSILNPEFLEQIDLYPGGFPARFGRSIGGIVTVETRSSKSDGVHGAADVDLLDAGGYVRFPVGKNGSMAVAGRRSYLDFMLGFFLPEPKPGARLLVVPVYYDYQARFDYDLKKEGKASLFAIGSSDALEVLSENPDDETSLSLNSAIRFFRVIGSYSRPLGGNLTLTLSPAYGRDAVVFSSGQADSSSPFNDIEIRQDTLSYRMRVHGRVHPRLVLDAGIDMESRVSRYDVLAAFAGDVAQPVSGIIDAAPEQTVRNVDMLAYGMHVDLAWDVNDHLRLIPGLRLDSYLLAGEGRTSLDPRLVARYRFDDRWLAKAYVGLFQQPSQPEAFDTQFGNPTLGLEKALHVGVGGEWTPTKLWTVDAEAYFVDRYDIVHFTTDTVQDPDTNQVRRVNWLNSGTSDTVGLELLIKRQVTSNMYGWLSYTLSRSMQQRSPDDPHRPTIFDQRHVLNAVASYNLDSGWEFGARFQLSTGRPSTPLAGSTFDVDRNGYDFLPGESRSERMPLFHKLDVRVDKTWLYNNWSLGLYLDIQNLFNVDNVEAIQYDYRYRASAPVTSIPFLPTIGIKGKW
jgi:TonB family protein